MTAIKSAYTSGYPANPVVSGTPSAGLPLVATSATAASWQPVSGQFLCAPAQYAPAARTVLTTASATLAAVTGAATTVAAGSNGGQISLVGSWSSPSAGVLAVASSGAFPSTGGTFTVATSTTTATCTYTGTAAGQLTGVAYVSGSATGTVSTGGAVTLTSAVISTGSFKAPASGSVLVTVSCAYLSNTSGNNIAFALAATGTVTPLVSNSVNVEANFFVQGTFPFLVSGLVAGNSYNFDLLFSSPSATTVTVAAQGSTSVTPAASSASPVTMTVQAV